MSKQLHANHRNRHKEKFRKGLLEPHEHVELMLYYPLKRINTNEIAHELIDELGGIRGMFNSDESKLTTIKGIGADTALFIRNFAEIIRLYQLEGCHTDELLTSDFELYKFLCAIFTGAYEEKAFMLMFSEKGKFIGYAEIGEGLDNQAIIPVRKALRKAISSDAASVIFAHNHPDGICIPSNADEATAAMLTVAFGKANITVRSHFLVADGRCIRFGE